MDFKKLKEKLAHAFAVDENFEPSAEDKALIAKVAEFVVRRKLEAPALMALESARPFNFMASQLMHFFQPTLALFLRTTELKRFAEILEHRSSIDLLVEAIEKASEEKETDNGQED